MGAWALVVDLTRSIHADTHRLANEAVAASAAGRAVIEQAKGVVMGALGVSSAEAFDRISSYRQRTNRKVVVIAHNIIDQVTAPTGEDRHRPGTGGPADVFHDL